MKNFLTLLLLLFVQQSFAEKLIFTNNNEQVDITGDADIDFQTGDISVTTVGEHEIINVSTQPVILGFYPSDYDVATGSTITVNWSVAFAESCTASTSPSGNTSWSGSKDSNNGDWNETGVNVTQLPATLQLECENAGNISTTKTFQLTEQTGGGGSNPSIDTFRVNSQSPFATVGPSTSAIVSWTTTDVSSCSASASPSVSGWSGVQTATGSVTVTIDENTVLTLTCGSLQSTVNVTYTLNSSCNASIYPNGLNAILATYESINDGLPFASSTNTSFLLDMGVDEFHSLSGFSFPYANARRRIVFSDAPTNFRLIDQGTMSVSECPGDFSSTAVCVIPVNNNTTVKFSSKPGDSPATYCKLDPAKTYFVNYINSPDPYNVTPSCASTQNQSCAMFYTEAALN